MSMKWEMEAVEAVLERIWDLHDRISDAIHSISRAYFLKSVKDMSGFVVVKDFRSNEDAAMAEARSLNAIRTALENLEDHLEIYHTIQSQQRAERDVAIAQLEQSRIILAMRLSDYQGNKYKVIEEASAFVGNVHDPGRFVAPENLYHMPRNNQSGGNLECEEGNKHNFLVQMLITSVELAKNSLKLEKIGGTLGNAALFAVSMLALLQLRRVAWKNKSLQVQHISYKRNEKNIFQPEYFSQSSQLRHLDVFSARG